jgi:undecaprenyl-diphosphatase
MTSILKIVVLSIIQGLTEWLPISSSGHLALAKELVGWQPPVVFFVFLHVGTLIVVIAFFRKIIIRMLHTLVHGDLKSEEGRLIIFIMLGSLPTAIIGYVFQGIFKSLFENILAVGVAFLATGFLLFSPVKIKDNKALSYVDSLIIGVAQGVSITPGISRSGATISAGLLRRINRKTAFEFSFLLSIPAVIGATIMELGDVQLLITDVELLPLIIGFTVSMIVGYVSLKILQKIISKRQFHWFAFYCWILGAIIIISQIA